MKSLLCFVLLITPLFSDQFFRDREGREFRIAPVRSVEEINLVQGKDILVRGFMVGYKDVPLEILNPDFKSREDMRLFYEDYFDSELEHYKNGELIWVQAFEGENLLGWATFELEQGDAAYMNLLVVDPEEARRGIGKQLTFSICSEFPQIQAIHLLIRKVNENGRKFYEKIGFSDCDYNRKDNFVDISLLTGLRWTP